MAQAQGLGLAHVDALHVVGLDAAHHLQQFLLVGLFQGYLEFVGHVKVILDRPLVTASHKDHFAHAGSVSFFHRILDQRFVHHRQHLLGLGLGGGQESGSETCHGENRLMDAHSTLQNGGLPADSGTW
jgi:hypothetical protein